MTEILPDATQEHQTEAARLRTSITALGVAAWSNVDYLVMVGSGEALKAQGLNGWAASGAVAIGTLIETTLVSQAAKSGMGDFSYEPKTRVGKAMAASSPMLSLWRGAPTGVMIDKAAGKNTDLKRIVPLHGLPYALAVGAWVSPNPVSETVVGTVESVAVEAAEAVQETATEHPAAAGGLALAAAIGAAAFIKRARKNKSAHS